MAYGIASAVEIDRKLREDFRKRVKETGNAAEVTDPVLAVIFRTFAQEIEKLYSETDRIRLALLDEFIAGLKIEPRRARPAQCVVRFFPDSGAFAMVPGGTELNAQTAAGARLTFITDNTIQVSGARIAFAAAYQNETIQLLAGIEMPEELQAARPSLDPVSVRLGPHPAIFLALEDLPASHLSYHSLYFELGPDSWKIQRALRSEPWCIVDNEGQLASHGILRPRRSNGGVRLLEWIVPVQQAAEEPALQEIPELPDGFFADRIFVFPYIPEERQFECLYPKLMGDALGRIFGREMQRAFSRRRTWIRIPLPPDVPPLHTTLGMIALHGITASNVECFNQTIRFEEQGVSIPISSQAGTKRHLVAPLAILGESNSPYLAEKDASNNRSAGRYAVRNGRLELRPAIRPDGKAEAYVNVRIWVTDAALANSVEPGQIAGVMKAGPAQNMRFINPVAAAGGMEDEERSLAEARFAQALLSRDRIVTEADLLAALHAFDRRIVDAEIHPAVVRTSGGLERVQQVTAVLDRSAFTDPAVELPLFQRELGDHLKERFVQGVGLDLKFEWNQ